MLDGGQEDCCQEDSGQWDRVRENRLKRSKLKYSVIQTGLHMSAGGEGVSTGIMLSPHCCCAVSEGKEEGARARAYNEHHSMLSMRVEGGYARGEGEPEE